MKKIVLTFVLAGLVPACAFADVTKEEIRRLLAAGASEQVVLTYVRQHGPVVPLSADDLVDLRAAGVGGRLLAELISAVAVPDADLPILAPPPEPVGGVFGNVYIYDSRIRSCLPARTRPIVPLCEWGRTFTTFAPRCAPAVVCRPAPPVCRPAPCRPIRSCNTTRR